MIYGSDSFHVSFSKLDPFWSFEHQLLVVNISENHLYMVILSLMVMEKKRASVLF